jgi:poly(A) polymerase
MTMHSPDPKREFAVEVVRRLKEEGFQALWAGGCVRDFLLGREPKDYDVATDARPEEVRELFGHRRTHAVGASFGVILLQGSIAAGNIEVATFRTEGEYLDGRHPEHVVFCTAEEDAKRRDFTINGMFYDPAEKQVLDYVQGEKDLGTGIVRAIGDPHDRVREDKLRMLRAVRFTATLEFELDAVTADAVREMAEEIHIVSAERITQELKQMLLDQHRKRAMELTVELGLLRLILPELDTASSQWETTLNMLQLLQAPEFSLTFAVLIHALQTTGERTPVSIAKAARVICKKRRFSNHETEHVCWLLAHKNDLNDAPELPLAKLKRLMAAPQIEDLIELGRVERLANNTEMRPVMFCEEYIRNTPAAVINPPQLISGDDLIALGLQPGPKFRDILETIRDAQLNEEISTHEEAHELLSQLLSNEAD